MKNVKILTVGVLVMSFLFTSFVFATNNDLVSSKDAEMAAKLFLQGRTYIDKRMDNVKLSKAEKYYDSNNELIAYVFSIENENNEIGYITISADYNMSPILEYSTDFAPQTKINQAISSIIKEKGDSYKVSKTRFMYLGPLLYVAKITLTDGVRTEEAFYNLKSQQMLKDNFLENVKSIKSNIPAKSFKYKWDKVKNIEADFIILNH